MGFIRNFCLCIGLILYTFCFAQETQIEDFTIPRLSPKPFAVTGLQQAQLSLGGAWNFKISNSTNQNTIHVPGEWEMQGFIVNEGETAIYTRELNIPADWKGKKIKLRFDGVSSHAIIKVNGKNISEHEGSFVPFEVDITSALNNDKNILQVAVQAQTISDKLACTSQYAAHTVGGILRNVILFALPETNISGITIKTLFDKQYKNATLKTEVQLANETSSNIKNTTLTFELFAPITNELVFSKKITLDDKINSNSTLDKTFEFPVQQPKKWDPEHPNLYTYKLTLEANGATEITERKIGFRQIEIHGNKEYVNGMPVKLRGACRHEIDPLRGRSLIGDEWLQDVKLFIEENVNYIRTSHYPPAEEFIHACDSLGMFVEVEGLFAGQIKPMCLIVYINLPFLIKHWIW